MKLFGFSLLELLVVVAIIGVLAGAGIIGYQLYLNGVKAEVVENARQEIDKSISTDLFVLESGVSGQPWLSADPNIQNQCISYVDALVDQLNAKFDNPYDSTDQMPYFNGHRDPADTTNYPEWSSGEVDATRSPLTPSGYRVSVPGGKTLVFCANWNAEPEATRIVTCANTASGVVDTTKTWAVMFATLADASEKPIPPGECPHPGSEVPAL